MAGIAAAVVLAGVAAWAAAQHAATVVPAPGAPAPRTVPAPASAPAAAPAATVAPSPAAHPPPAKGPQKALDKPVWSQLTAPQQVALEPLASEWDRMDGVRKKKWLEMANRFASMKPEEQQRVQERMREWVKLTPAQRNLARENYTRAKKIAPSQKSATWESYQQLPEEQKQKLAAEAAARKSKNPRAIPPLPAGGKVPAVLSGATACPAGTIKNAASATPACVPVAAAPAPVPAAVAPVTVAPPPAPPAPQPANTFNADN